jgi:hypothetical protein
VSSERHATEPRVNLQPMTQSFSTFFDSTVDPS